MPTINVTPVMLEEIAEKAKLDPDFVKDLYAEKLTEFGPDAALFQLVTALKSHKRSPAVPCEGVILEVTAPFDWTTGPKNAQLKRLNQLLTKEGVTKPNDYILETLINLRYIHPDSTPDLLIFLDTKATFNSGKTNPNFGKPWPPAEQTTIMNIRGVAKPTYPFEGKEIPMRKFSLTISDPEWFKAEPGINNVRCTKHLSPFKPFADTKLIFKPENSTETFNAFNISSLTEFSFIDEEIDVLAFCKKFIPENVQTVTKLHEHFAKFGSSPDEFVVFEGGVQFINNKPSPIGTRRLRVDDPYASPLDMFTDDGDVVPDTSVEVSKHVPITFARGTRAIFVGTTKQKAIWVQGKDGQPGHEHPTEKELIIEANAIYPIPAYTIKAAEPSNLPEPSEW